MNNTLQLAEILCRATHHVLWTPNEQWARQRKPQIVFQCRVGSGRATYHLHKDNIHVITYGQKMLISKRNISDARSWITGYEIESRQYFGGRLNYAQLLAHTCCHEFSHLIQAINGWWKRGSIHNQDFYRILDQLHESDKAKQVLEFINTQACQQNIDLNFFDASSSEENGSNFSVGDTVWLTINGEKVAGQVKRINKRTVSVYPTAQQSKVRYYRIPPSQLIKRA